MTGVTLTLAVCCSLGFACWALWDLRKVEERLRQIAEDIDAYYAEVERIERSLSRRPTEGD